MRIRAGLWTATVALTLSCLPWVASPAQAAPAPDAPADEHASARADEALDTARDLFTTRRPAHARLGGRPGTTHRPDAHDHTGDAAADPEHASAVLRDLAVSLPDLSRAERRQARAILARPTDGRPDTWGPAKYEGADSDAACSDEARICLHWVSDPEHKHAPADVDDDGDGVPDAIDEYQRVLEEVWQRIVVELGYRQPRSDLAAPNHGPDGRTDIYLAELGEWGMYGYCTMDRPRLKAAYCVLDNDFTGFPAPPGESLRVTAAHEFFHAVQFAYSTRADLWLMEGTAAWVEDEVYDGINDNLQYLSRSALWLPGSSLDRITPPGVEDAQGFNWRYGSWIWWRFLTEYLGKGEQRDSDVVRQIWNRVATDRQGERSLPAQRRVLRARGTTFGDAFARFGAANRVAPRWYLEGRAYARFVAPADGRFTLQRKRRSTQWRQTRLDHLSTRHAVVRPGKSLRGPWRLRVEVDLPRRARGPKATVAIHFRDGRVRWRNVRLDRKGVGRVRVLFNQGRVRYVALSLTNASTRMKECGRQGVSSPYSCGGTGVDDGLRFVFRGTVVRPR